MKKAQIAEQFKIFVMILIASFAFFSCSGKPVEIGKLSDMYITAWKNFYPSAAFASGDKDSAFRFETLSKEKIEQWLALNKNVLSETQNIHGDLSFDDRIDIRILKKTTRSEIETWEVDQAHENSPSLYAGLISQAMTYVLVRSNLSPGEKIKAISNRLTGIRKICAFAKNRLKSGRPAQTGRSIQGLESSARFYSEKLPTIAAEWIETGDKENFKKECSEAGTSIETLITHIKEKIQPAVTQPDTLSKEVYAKKLRLYTGLDITPEKLEKISLEEIHRIRGLMEQVAKNYWEEAYPEREIPSDLNGLVGKALQDMEADREDNQKGFLELFLDLIDRAEAFVREKKISPVPDKRTLFTDLSPAHFAGAAVGGVYSAGPFDPDADTLFYLPTVPDSAPADLKEGFYRSFNNHFNTMIITHEMFPGHYLQLKIAAGNSRLIRPLFGCSLFAEGWATLCEQLTLDAGWNNNNNLTRLAHLRKILENATRAYVSVKVHCNGWDKEKLTGFAVNTGLLAPQFAINLWHRVIGSPFQLTSYFLGFKAFSNVYEQEKKKAGENFSLYDFSKKILYTGSLPIDMLPDLF
jgi:uncharacterized protein (DUF885 family)